MNFMSNDNPIIVLDQYLGGEELQELTLEEGNVFDNDLPNRTSQIDVFDNFQWIKTSKRFENATLEYIHIKH